MPPLPADSIHARACKLKCEKILTRPDECGRFVLSADTIGEAKRDLDELEKRTSSP